MGYTFVLVLERGVDAVSKQKPARDISRAGHIAKKI
jgi:hypothetical protein